MLLLHCYIVVHVLPCSDYPRVHTIRAEPREIARTPGILARKSRVYKDLTGVQSHHWRQCGDHIVVTAVNATTAMTFAAAVSAIKFERPFWPSQKLTTVVQEPVLAQVCPTVAVSLP